jgi:hypothetical protein
MSCSDSILKLFGGGAAISNDKKVTKPLLLPPQESVESQLMTSRMEFMRSKTTWLKSLDAKHKELEQMSTIAYKGTLLHQVALEKLAHMKDMERYIVKIEKGLLAIDKAVLMLENARMSKLQLGVVYQTKEALKEAILAIGRTEDIENVAEELQETIQEVEQIQREVNRASEPRTAQQYDDKELERELDDIWKVQKKVVPTAVTSSSSPAPVRTPVAMM